MRTSVKTKKLYLIGLIIIQAVCALFFVYDASQDILEDGTIKSLYSVVEVLATLAMFAAMILEVSMLRGILQNQERMERSLQVAKGKLQDVINTYFADWGLTPAEMDVAILAIKGFSITEMSELRQAQEGTIKTQLTSIYRKAGVTGRNQLGSLLIEDLMGTPL
jgi:DNA-binding CsgD family transcriptional regulator